MATTLSRCKGAKSQSTRSNDASEFRARSSASLRSKRQLSGPASRCRAPTSVDSETSTPVTARSEGRVGAVSLPMPYPRKNREAFSSSTDPKRSSGQCSSTFASYA